nr:MAG TPA: hypothetical protein [Bacteriophage sp.]
MYSFHFASGSANVTPFALRSSIDVVIGVYGCSLAASNIVL